MMTVKNIRYAVADQSMIDLNWDHPDLGLIPITITEAEYPDLWAEAIAATPAPYVPPDPELHRIAWRQTAFLSRAAFCLALYRADILSPAEAIAAGKGDWPDSFTVLLAAMPEGIDPAEAQIIWAAVTQIERLHPLFEAVRQFHGMTPEAADDLFGWK